MNTYLLCCEQVLAPILGALSIAPDCSAFVRIRKKGKAILAQALRVSGGSGSQILRQSVHKGGTVVNPMQRPPLPPRKYSWYSFLLEGESTHSC